MNMAVEQEYWLWLAQRKGLSTREKKVLLLRFGSIKKLFLAQADALAPMGLSEKAMASLLDKNIAEIVKLLAKCNRLGVGILTYADDTYPRRLRTIDDSPLVLYYWGNLPDWDRFVGIGVVGTRKATAHALKSAKTIAYDLCKGGGAVVSGMAAGVDTYATLGALDAGGIALGVLGCGIDIEYPAENHNLYTRMKHSGCLLSEYPPGMRAQQWTFPERNRIISALSEATLVVEAPQRSGALITAKNAKQQGKLLFAMPGPKDFISCAGSNSLLEQGALKAETAADILQQLPALKKKQVDKAAPISYHGADETASPQALCILEALRGGPMTVDEVIVKSALPSSRALMEITRLELQGQIYRPDAMRIAIK